MARDRKKSFRERFGNENGRRPDCFGETEEYTLRDHTCRRCAFRDRCSVIVNRKRDRAEEEEENEGRRSRGRRDDDFDPADYEEREDDGQLGFLGALKVNSGLSAMERVADEVSYSLRQIPRFSYPDPFADAMKKGRRSVIKEDE